MKKGKKKVVDITKLEVPNWAKEGVIIWIEIRDKLDVEPEKYLMGSLVSVDEAKKTANVKYDGEAGPSDVYIDRIHMRSETPQNVDDLCDIDPLNDAELLKCMEYRFKDENIYCYCGPTLIATNPYKMIAKMNNIEDKRAFRKYALGKGKPVSMPHVWNLASSTFYQLFDSGMKQAICISGESGAGKTVGTKLCMNFFTTLFEDEEGEVKSDETPIEDQILACNPIMESFGNAKTVRNDNSSRFGKYFIMYVDKNDKHIKGAEIKNYLLEKSRIVTQAPTERNYHIFYGALTCMPPDLLKKYRFNNSGDKVDMKNYKYLAGSGCFSVPTIDDKEFYDDTCDSFNKMGFSPEEVDAVWKMLSCVLNLGNVDIDDSKFDDENPCTFKASDFTTNVVEMLEVNKEELETSICVTVRKVLSDVIKTPRSKAQCINIRDALAKDLFNNVFNWIVKKLNLSLLPDNPEQYTSIGLLDIFGFEDFEVNSIEQFCINYTNEKLQNLYISYVFEAEKVIFQEEGLGDFIKYIKYTNNIDIIDMLDKKPQGIFYLVDSAKEDNKLKDSISSNYMKNPYYFENRLKKELFGIKHTAKDVYYTVTGFVEKNKDELPETLMEVMKGCNKDISKIFLGKMAYDEELPPKPKNFREKYLGYKFRQEMQSLMAELLSCECNFVRCIKPNESKKKNFWVPELALTQIRYLGILDSINVRRESLPVRRNFKKFYKKYQDLDDLSEKRNTPYSKLETENANFKEMIDNIIKSLKEDFSQDILLGNTKVFMSAIMQNELNKRLELRQRVKIEALNKIREIFIPFNFANRWSDWRSRQARVIILSRSLLKTWNSKVEYSKFKSFLRVVNNMQRKYRTQKALRLLREQKKATKIIARAHQVYKVKLVLGKAKTLMKTLANCAKKIKFKAFIARIHINKRIVNDIFDIAWLEIEGKIKKDACCTVQRIFRGYQARLDSIEEVERLKLIKEQVKKSQAATTIQKMARGFLVRQRMDRLQRAARFIQGYTRMLWLSRYYKVLKLAVRKIQRCFRKHFIKKKKIDERMFGFLRSNKEYVNSLRKVEHDIIFKGARSFDNPENLEAYSKVKFFESKGSFRKAIPHVTSFIPDMPAIDLNHKMRLFSLLIDFDCHVDTSDIYQQSWAVDYRNMVNKLESRGNRLLHLEVGETFTLAISDDFKVYSWGLNDYQQLARPLDLAKGHFPPKICNSLSSISPRIMASGDEHTIMVDYSNNVYMWGSNENGQLGLGHSRRVQSIVKLTQLGRSIKTIAARGDKSYVINGDGRMLAWPNQGSDQKFTPIFCKVPEQAIKFMNVSCGYGFAIALSTNGLLFSSGENQYGQLGLGDSYEREDFHLIEHFKEVGEKVTEISCGAKHSIAKTTNGKVFTWGLGNYGQLGNGAKRSSRFPILAKIGESKSRNYKAISVQAGLNSSYVLLENRKVYHAGSNTFKNKEDIYFNNFNYEAKVFNGKIADEFTPLKLYTKWSKAISTCYMMIGDFREVKQSKKVRDKISSQINISWESCYNQILPPVDEMTSRYMCPKYIKKLRKKASPSKRTMLSASSPARRKRTLGSTTKSGARTTKLGVKKTKKGKKSGKKVTKEEQAFTDLKGMKGQLEKLMHKPAHQWSLKDRQLLATIRSLNGTN